MAPKIERISDSASVLGEGPHWDEKSQTLYYVDILGHYILKYKPSTKEESKVNVGKHISIVIPVEGKKNQFVVTLLDELAIIEWDGKSDKFTVIEKLAQLGKDVELTFNDGKCDSSGRLWAGSMPAFGEGIDLNSLAPVGSLISLRGRALVNNHIKGIRLANGIAFNDKEKKFFYIDTLKRTIDQYDFDITTGSIKNLKVLFTLDKNNIGEGGADGMTIDTDGNLWVAIFNGAKVIKIDGHKPETLLQTVELPAKQITSVAFGGPNLDELYVTSGSIPLEGERPALPANGATYRVTGLGVKGYPGVAFKL